MGDNTVKKYTDLFRLKKIPDGAIYEVQENGKFYIKQGHNWDEMTTAKFKANGGPTISLYELNQSSVMQFPPLSKETLIEKYYEKITDWFNSISYNNHFLLLSAKYSYYTFFAQKEFLDNDTQDFAGAVLNIIGDFSKVYSVSFDESNNAWEIWACLFDTDKAPEIFYLFPYEAGVVYYG